MKITTIKISGLTPLLMHSGRLADPLEPATQALARLTSKRKKTLDDHKEMAKCEWYGSIYVDEKGHPCLPGEVLEASLVDGAKRFKMGTVAKSGIVVAESFKLIYDGPKTVDALWENGGFVKRYGVRVGQSRVMRARPIFMKWACRFDVTWDPSVVRDEKQVREFAESAGISGIGDWRPKFGRYELV